jgi:glyoxylase-like metal-dependent hydrolase (beta-lactamase superfamily II)
MCSSQTSSSAQAVDDWTEPGAYEVSSGIYRLPLPMPNDGLRAVNVYAIDADEGLLLVDGGWALAEAREALEKALGTIGHGVSEIYRVVVTHVHRDHYTLAVALRREFGTRIALGLAERDSLERVLSSSADGTASLAALRRGGAEEMIPPLLETGFGTSPPPPGTWELPDEWFSGGERIPIAGERGLDAIHTPGHTKGHLVFAETSRNLLFTGDHVLPHITPSIGFEAVPAHLPLQDYMSSLRLVRAMPDMTMLPAHGRPGPSVHARVDELLQHHQQRLDQCHAAVRPTGTTAYEVARQLVWTGRGRRFADLDVFNQMLAVSETLAHLEVLVADGRLASEDRGDTRIYHV